MLRLVSVAVHAIAITPVGPMELVRSSLSIVSGLPCEKVRSAPAIVFSGPAQRSLMLWPARSRSRLQTTLCIESSDSFVASAAVSIATGWSEPVPGRELHPLKSSAFSRRTFSTATLDLAPWEAKCECSRGTDFAVSRLALVCRPARYQRGRSSQPPLQVRQDLTDSLLLEGH